MSHPEGERPRLRQASSGGRWIGPAAVAAVLMLAFALVITVFAPSPAWFLLYPVLVVGAIAALATGAAWLLRHF
jgi:hypothetical protein